jgi:hypothetical protein
MTMNITGTLAERTYIWVYDSSFKIISGRYRLFSQISATVESDLISRKLLETDAAGNWTKFVIDSVTLSTGNASGNMSDVAYMRISCEEITSESIITVNQPIV